MFTQKFWGILMTVLFFVICVWAITLDEAVVAVMSSFFGIFTGYIVLTKGD